VAEGKDEPFSFRLLQLFGAFPAVMDRHVTEFFTQFFADGRYYGKTLGVDAFSFEDTIESGDRIHEEMQEVAISDGPLPDDYFDRIGGEHEQVLDIIESIRNDAGDVYSANLPNLGQVPNLPRDAILESPAIAKADGLHPIDLAPLSSGIVGTLATRLAWVETVVEAALEGNRDKVVQALIVDGAVDSIETACKLADELLSAQAEYLPQFG
jgi:alpha-galactosidase